MKSTQGQRLVKALMRRAMTYGDMLALGVSTAPWKRIKEALRGLPNLRLIKGKRKCGCDTLVTWRVGKV